MKSKNKLIALRVDEDIFAYIEKLAEINRTGISHEIRKILYESYDVMKGNDIEL